MDNNLLQADLADEARAGGRRRVWSERSSPVAAREGAVANALDAARARLARAKRAYADAMNDGCSENGVECQEEISEVLLEIRGLSWQMQRYEAARRHPPISAAGAPDEAGDLEPAIAALRRTSSRRRRSSSSRS
jgi:hypothetical protein